MTKPSKSGSDSGSKSGSGSDHQSSSSKTKVGNSKTPEYVVKNPVVDILWYDPRKRYTGEAVRNGWNRIVKLTAKNYSSWPMVLLSAGIVPVTFTWFQSYRITQTPDVWSGPNQNPHWDKYEHKHAKLNDRFLCKECKDNLKKEHPRPRFDWQYPTKGKKYHLPALLSKKESSHKTSHS